MLIYLNMYSTIQRLYQPNEQWADSLLIPQRYCHRQWEDLTNLSDSRQIVQVAYLIAAIIPLTLVTLLSSLLVPVGLLLKACTEHNPPKPASQDRNYIGQDLVTLQARIRIDEAAEQTFKANAFMSACATKSYFFYGACDLDLTAGASDLGWGCAWRCLQTLLASQGIFYGFRNLYKDYQTTKTSNEWGEPGYAARICKNLGISYQLYLYQYKKTPKIAKEEFNDTELTTFESLTTKLFEHFQTKQTPVMVDDGWYAYTLLGIKKSENEQITLWIADPHKTTLEAALYTITLNKEGKVIHSTGLDNGANGLSSSQRITLQHGWMLLFF